MRSHEQRATQKKRGRPPKLGEHQSYPLRLPAELHQQLKHYVVDHPDKSLNDLIVEAVAEWWSRVPGRRKYVRFVEDAHVAGEGRTGTGRGKSRQVHADGRR
jgi:hypothetical protein